MMRKTCEDCQFYTPDVVDDGIGICEILECMMLENELSCIRFVDKEND